MMRENFQFEFSPFVVQLSCGVFNAAAFIFGLFRWKNPELLCESRKYLFWG